MNCHYVSPAPAAAGAGRRRRQRPARLINAAAVLATTAFVCASETKLPPYQGD